MRGLPAATEPSARNRYLAEHADRLTDELARLILDYIPTVPHIEALMLVWEGAPRAWSEAEVAERIYQPPEVTRAILRDLQRKGLVEAFPESGQYTLAASPEVHRVAERITSAYKNNLYRVATLIHTHASPAVREFARAFELKEKK
jgi:hypothetical protein